GEPDMPALKISQRSGLRSRPCAILGSEAKGRPGTYLDSEAFKSAKDCLAPFVLVPNMLLVSADEVDRMRRREFLALLGGAAAAWPLAAGAQQTMRVIGFLGGADPTGFAVLTEAFRSALRDHGYIEGQNVRIEYRWAEGYYERLPGLAADLVSRKVNIIITQGTPAPFAAKQATTSIPIV